MSTRQSIFIGIDLSDPFAKCKQPCARATISANLNCLFDEWGYEPTGYQIVPDKVLRLPYILAIDGPQGLAGNPGCTMRLSERKLGTAGKSPYAFHPIGYPYAGFVRGSVELFYSLSKSPVFHLYALQTDKKEPNLIEVYPGSAWPIIAGRKLPKKRLLAGRRARYELLLTIGIKFSSKYTLEVLPTHDQLDAAIAAYVAYLFTTGQTRDCGQNPLEDERVGILREGFIIQPMVV